MSWTQLVRSCWNEFPLLVSSIPLLTFEIVLKRRVLLLLTAKATGEGEHGGHTSLAVETNAVGILTLERLS
jgi:hypothetical protein